MKKIVVDMQNFLFADSIATAFKNSDYDIAVVRAESPRDTIELCRVFKPFVLLMEVTAYTPWLLCERMKLRDEAKTVCPDCKIALIVDSNTEKQAAKDIREAKKNGIPEIPSGSRGAPACCLPWEPTARSSLSENVITACATISSIATMP